MRKVHDPYIAKQYNPEEAYTEWRLVLPNAWVMEYKRAWIARLRISWWLLTLAFRVSFDRA